MALPAPGNQITFSQIRTEISGSGDQPLSEAGTILASITAGQQVRTSADLGGTSAQTLQFNSSYLFYWAFFEYGSGVGSTAYITIIPDATFATSSNAYFAKTTSQAANTCFYYPSGQNVGPARFATSTLTASGYSCTGDCTVSLEQGMNTLCTTMTCLDENTKITLSNGKELAVKNLKRGDKVLAFDFEKMLDVESTIEEVGYTMHDDMVKITLEDREITCTSDHPFLSKDSGWVSNHGGYTNRRYENVENCQPMIVGDYLLTADGWRQIKNIFFHIGSAPAWQITSAEYDNYYADGIFTKVEKTPVDVQEALVLHGGF